jgi:HK97 family phage portal protein
MRIKDRILKVIIGKAFRLFPYLYQSWETNYGMADDSDAEAYTKTYSAASWVYICVRRIAQTCAMMADELKFYRKSRDEIELITDGEVVELFDQVNPFISKTELIESVVSHRLLNGNAYWAIEGNGKKELYPMRPDRIKIIPDAKEFIRAYDYTINGKRIRFDADEVIHFKYFNAENDYYGLSPLAVARMCLTLDFHALTWNKNFFKNEARPDGMLETDQDINDPTYQRLKKEWAEYHKGTANAHKIAMLTNGLKYHVTSLSPKDVEFLNMRKMNREEICAIFGVPPGEVGILEYSNYANLKEQRQIFWEDTIVPELKAISNTLNEKFIKTFDPKLFCKFDLSNVTALKEDEEKKMNVARGLVSQNIFTINEVRKDMYNKEPLEWGDQPIQQISLGSFFSNPEKSTSRMIQAKDVKLLSMHKAVDFTPVQQEHWKKFDINLTNNEKLFKLKMIEFLDGQKERILANVQEFLNLNYLSLSIRILPKGTNYKFSEAELDQIFDLLKENSILENISREEFKRIVAEVGNAAALELGVDFNYSPLTPQIEAWLRMKIQALVKSVNENIRQEVANIIIDGIDKGLGLDDISGNIADHLNQTKDFRSDRIANTEVHSTSNLAILDAFKQSGAVKGKEWIAKMPPEEINGYMRPRLSHQIAHGQTVDIDTPFNVGADLLMFPGDVGGSPEEVINCRCTIKAVFKE